MVEKQKALTLRRKILRGVKAVIVLSVAALIFWQAFEQRSVSLHYLDGEKNEHTLTLTYRDKKRLQSLMEMLFAMDNFSYTLLGTKPLAWAMYQVPFSLRSRRTFSYSISRYNRTLHNGWKTWGKYQHLFSESLLFSEAPKCYPDSRSILLVNKEQFNSVVRSNKKDFEDVLGKKIEDGFQLLDKAKSTSLMSDVLQDHQALMGIVLGYGRENSWKFLEKCEVREPLGWVWTESEYMQENEETTEYNSQIEDFLYTCSCPSFAGIPTSEESLELKRGYLETKQKVLDYYKGKDFLEAVLSLLAGYRTDE